MKQRSAHVKRFAVAYDNFDVALTLDIVEATTDAEAAVSVLKLRSCVAPEDFDEWIPPGADMPTIDDAVSCCDCAIKVVEVCDA